MRIKQRITPVSGNTGVEEREEGGVMGMEGKEKVQSPLILMKQEEIVPYILLEHLILAHKVAAKQGRAVATILLTRFILKFSKKLKEIRSKSIAVKLGYRSEKPID